MKEHGCSASILTPYAQMVVVSLVVAASPSQEPRSKFATSSMKVPFVRGQCLSLGQSFLGRMDSQVWISFSHKCASSFGVLLSGGPLTILPPPPTKNRGPLVGSRSRIFGMAGRGEHWPPELRMFAGLEDATAPGDEVERIHRLVSDLPDEPKWVPALWVPHARSCFRRALAAS